MNLDQILAACSAVSQEVFNDRLLGVILYGSAAVQDFVPGASDINILLLVKDTDQETLRLARTWHRQLAKHRVTAPLLLTPDFIRRSADVFPIEFLEIKEKHRVLQGTDPLADLDIKLTNLRHECEHELKGRLLRLRQSFVELDRPAALRSLLLAAHNSNFPAFRTALRLKGITPPLKKEEVLQQLAERFALNAAVLAQLQSLRQEKHRTPLQNMEQLFQDYYREVEKLAQAVDAL